MRFWKISLSGLVAAVLLLVAFLPVLAANDSAPDKVQVLFQNKTGSPIRITLTGPQQLYLSLVQGKTKSELVPGIYSYSYSACGKTITGIFKVKDSGANLTLDKCESESGSSTSGLAHVQFENKTGDSVRITLIGPTTAYLTLSSGRTKSDLTPGTYSYTYSACGKTNTGSFKVKKSGDILVLPKCATGGGVGEGKIKIKNNTYGSITIILTGAHNYTFYVSPGTSQLTIATGKYNYTAYGCGGSIDTGIVKPGDTLTFFCIYY